ncbi:MAG: ribonuclease P protein component [Planctomycetota bacterium]
MHDPDAPSSTRRYRYTRAHRLSGSRAYQRVFDNKLRKSAGPLAVLAAPVDLPHHRLGLVVSRRVGNAVRRHQIKRMLREAFRLNQHDWPGAYDVVVIVYRHDKMPLDGYARLLGRAVEQVHAVAERRGQKEG